jgi:hypothetical protein
MQFSGEYGSVIHRDVTSCCLVERFNSFDGNCCISFQRREAGYSGNSSKTTGNCFFFKLNINGRPTLWERYNPS